MTPPSVPRKGFSAEAKNDKEEGMDPQTESPMTFESALEKLQATVRKLESGELNLEESLKSFEEGVSLIGACQQHLKSAEQRIEILTQAHPDGKAETQPFTGTKSSR